MWLICRLQSAVLCGIVTTTAAIITHANDSSIISVLCVSLCMGMLWGYRHFNITMHICTNDVYLSLIRTYTDITHICCHLFICLIAHTNIYLIPIFISERHKHEFGYCSPHSVCDLYDRTTAVPTIVCDFNTLHFFRSFISFIYIYIFFFTSIFHSAVWSSVIAESSERRYTVPVTDKRDFILLSFLLFANILASKKFFFIENRLLFVSSLKSTLFLKRKVKQKQTRCVSLLQLIDKVLFLFLIVIVERLCARDSNHLDFVPFV